MSIPIHGQSLGPALLAMATCLAAPACGTIHVRTGAGSPEPEQTAQREQSTQQQATKREPASPRARVAQGTPEPAAEAGHDGAARDAPADGAGSAGPERAAGDAAAQSAAAVAGAVCRGRSPCKAIEDRDAGRDAAGRALHVLHLALDEKNEADRSGMSGDCAQREWWLAVSDANAVASTQLLVAICNDGYGAAGVGTDEIEVRPNELTHMRSGGSAWRWGSSTTLSLSPLAVLEETLSGGWTLGPNRSAERWSWRAFGGTESWFAPPCSPASEAEIEAPAKDPYEAILIPDVELDAAYVQGGWRATALGRCAASLGGGSGFVVRGVAGPSEDAAVKVVAAGDILFVEVKDDRPIGPSGSPLADDHLEIWLAQEMPGYADHCLSQEGMPSQWVVRVADGRVVAGRGRPGSGAPKVERFDASGVLRFKIALPPKQAGITVAYGDGDDGRTQKSLTATSRLVPGVTATLGRRRAIPKEHAVCRVSNGSLEPEITRRFESGRAVIE